jgi:mycothiol synthase
MSDRLKITTATRLSPELVAAVLTLVTEATRADGVPPLNEAALLHLRRGHGEIEHLIAKGDGQIVGYAQRQDRAVPTGELVVSPVRRGQGIGTALLDALIGRGPVQVLAVGNRLAAQALARSHGMQPLRTLLIMERSLEDPVPDSAAPDGVIIRTFRPGADEDDWIMVNARAFADHPEQGRITRRDLEDRMAESWFDPAGFFVAISAGRMVGFHWTKQHEDQLGEIYVLGVDPLAGGQGLGKALLTSGLRHLKRRGNTRVQLYVEADHGAAIALYSAYGFRVASRDVMYASAESPPRAAGQIQP